MPFRRYLSPTGEQIIVTITDGECAWLKGFPESTDHELHAMLTTVGYVETTPS